MSTVKANDLTNVTGGIPTVKGQKLIPTAWINFNGKTTVAINASENVSSLVDIGVGRWRIYFEPLCLIQTMLLLVRPVKLALKEMEGLWGYIHGLILPLISISSALIIRAIIQMKNL